MSSNVLDEEQSVRLQLVKKQVFPNRSRAIEEAVTEKLARLEPIVVLLENPGLGGTLNHLGVEVQSSDTVHKEIARLSGEGLFTDEEIGTTCCFATQDKVWVTGPAGEKWEVYTVLSDSDTFGTSPQHLDEDGTTEGGVCCGGISADAKASAGTSCC